MDDDKIICDEELTEDNIRYIKATEGVGQRIDVYLSKVLGLTRSNVQKLIKDNRVIMYDKALKANYQIRPQDDTIAVTIPELEPIDVLPQNIPIDILYEDEQVIVVNKAKGMVVHPAPGNYDCTLVNALLYHCQDLSGINGVLRPGIVHRLDKDTSGVMIVAKTDLAHISLAKQIQEKTATRIYLAIVQGNVKNDTGEIIAAIGRDTKDRKRMAVTTQNAKYAHTNYRVLERFGRYTLVACMLQTGRTHQIRVHMAYIGHPLLGDSRYGGSSGKFSIEGQALHSTQLTFNHPLDGRKIVCNAKLPAELKKILYLLRQVRG